jgi:hypothetical protein
MRSVATVPTNVVATLMQQKPTPQLCSLRLVMMPFVPCCSVTALQLRTRVAPIWMLSQTAAWQQHWTLHIPVCCRCEIFFVCVHGKVAGWFAGLCSTQRVMMMLLAALCTVCAAATPFMHCMCYNSQGAFLSYLYCSCYTCTAPSRGVQSAWRS